MTSLSVSERSFVMEDLRIATLQRKLARSASLSSNVALALAEQITLALRSSENKGYVRRASSIIVDVGLDMLVAKKHDQRVKQETILAMATVAAIVNEEEGDKGLKAFIEHLFHYYDMEDIGESAKKSLLTLLNFVLTNEKLYISRNSVDNLVHKLQPLMELEQAEVMLQAALCLDKVAVLKPNLFEAYFQELVDILVGWYIEDDDITTISSSSLDVESRRSSIAAILEGWHSFWLADMTFSAGLMQHFMEDLQSEFQKWRHRRVTELEEGDDEEMDEQSRWERMETFMRIFHVTLKCLKGPKKSKSRVSLLPGQCSSWFVIIMEDISALLKDRDKESDDEGPLAVVGIGADIGIDMINEISGIVQDKIQVITQFIQAFLDNFENLGFASQQRCVEFMINVLRMASSSDSGTSEETTAILLDPLMPFLETTDSSLIQALVKGKAEYRRSFVSLMRSLLSSKNVRLLQQVYGKLVKLFDSVVRQELDVVDVGSQNPKRLEERQVVALVVMQCLTDLATQKGSMLGLWALQPSIFDHCHDTILYALEHTSEGRRTFISKALLQALVHMMKAHCETHKNFVLSSSLVLDDKNAPTSQLLSQRDSFSSTAKNLERIIKLLVHLFHFSNDPEKEKLIQRESRQESEVFRVAMQWTQNLLDDLIVSQVPVKLYESELFRNLLNCLINCGRSDQANVTVGMLTLVLTNLELVLKCLEFSRKTTMPASTTKEQSDEEMTVKRILDVAHFHMGSRDSIIRSKCLELVTSIDPFIEPLCLMDSLTMTTRKKLFNEYSMNEVMRSGDCQAVIRSLLRMDEESEEGKQDKNVEESKEWPKEKIVNDFSLLENQQVRLHVNAMLSLKPNLYRMITSNSALFTGWISFELANFCVNSKLKTPLGKAKETLLAIEKCLRDLHVCLKENKVRIDVGYCRQLLLFFRDLERCVNNACNNGSFTWTTSNDTKDNSSSNQSDANNRSVTAFFVANRRICVDWMSRLRPVVVSLAFFVVRDLSTVIEQCERGLEELEVTEDKDRSEDKEVFISFLASALFQMKNKAGVQGLQQWLDSKDNGTQNHNFVIEALDKERNDFKDEALKLLLAQTSTRSGDVRRLRDEMSFSLLTNSIKKESLSTFEEWMSFYKRNGFQCREELLRRQQNSLKTLTAWTGASVDGGEEDEKIGLDGNRNESLNIETNLSLLRLVGDLEKGAGVDKKAFDRVIGQLEECLRNDVYNHAACNATTKLLLLIAKELRDVTHGLHSFSSSILSSLSTSALNCSQLLLMREWRHLLTRLSRHSRLLQPLYNNQNLSHLDLDIAKASMKEKKSKLASECLYEALFKSSSMNMDVSTLAITLDRMDFKKALLTQERAKAFSMSARLISETHLNTSIRIDVGIVERIGTLYVYNTDDDDDLKKDMLEVSSEALSNVAQWLETKKNSLACSEIERSDLNAMLDPLLLLEKAFSSSASASSWLLQYDDVDVQVGRLLRLSLLQSPHLYSVWNDFALWALRTGEELLERSSKKLIMTQEDKSKLKLIIEQFSIRENTLEDFIEILTQKYEAQSSEEIRFRLRQMLNEPKNGQNPDDTETLITQLVDFRRHIETQLFFYHTSAIRAFFHFIDESDASQKAKLISATLKVLQITVKYTQELSECLQEGLSTTKSEKWRPIVPQLFSRLNHPVSSVRRRISNLLCRMANDYPDLIMFPAIVGHLDNSKNIETKSQDNQFDLDNQTLKDTDDAAGLSAEDGDSMSSNAYSRIASALENRLPQSVDAVRLLVQELRRVSSLPDELWLTTLQQSSSDINRRLRKMDEEVNRLQTNHALSQEERQRLTEEKYNILFRPLLYILDQLEANTCVVNDLKTTHELQFIRKYGSFIETAMTKARTPTDFARPKEGWLMLVNQLQVSLSQKLTSKTKLSLSDVSPKLSHLKDTAIPMPGTTSSSSSLSTSASMSSTSSSSLVTISKLEDVIETLLTKTKPKKMVMRGSDGKQHTFLFKGLEDLHLDERIMQFLAVSNCLMASTKQDLEARHYSVTPLGRRSGLIQWVSGAVPLYSIFKKWQTRHLATAKADQKPSNIITMKPADFFYSKLMPVLKKEGLESTRRSLWPSSMMLGVLHELQNETPREIFARELMQSSLDARHWLEMRSKLTQSIAVMSILGYVLGLGDRHLENLLIDFDQAEIVHIDYNVCFEKGLQLRIPERVPFRLTRNIRAIFGITGVHGQFTHACLDTMKVLRDGRDTLLTLLEAFVYDPLVDWTPQMATLIPGVTKSMMSTDQMQTQVSLSMLSVRVAEMRTQWLANRDDLVNCLKTLVEDNFDGFIEAVTKLDGLHQTLASRHEDMALIKQCQAQSTEALLKHPVFNASSAVFQSKMKAQMELSEQRNALRVMVDESEKRSHQLQRALALVMSHSQLNSWFRETSRKEEGDDDNSVVTSFLVQAFLEQAGQQGLSRQLEDAEKAVRAVINKQRRAMSNLIQLLSHLCSIVTLLPSSYKEFNHNVIVADLGSSVVEEMSSEKCQCVLRTLERYRDQPERTLAVVKMNLEMHFWTHELQRRLNEVLTRLNDLADPKTSLRTALNDLNQSIGDRVSSKKMFVLDIFDAELMSMCDNLIELENRIRETQDELPDIVSEKGNCFLIDEVLAETKIAASMIDDYYDDLGLTNLDELRTNDVETSAKQKAGLMKTVIEQLSHLKQSFFGVVLPEALKAFQRGDTSVYKMDERFKAVVDVAGMGLDEMLKIIDEKLHTAAQQSTDEEGKSRSEDCIEGARRVCDAYTNLLKGVSDSHQKDTSNLNSGQMLLLAFDSLFTHLNNALTNFNGQTTKSEEEGRREELTGLRFNVHRLHLMERFFHHCRESAALFDIDSSGNVVDVNKLEDPNALLLPTLDDMARDIKVFVAETIRHRIAGRFSSTLKIFLGNRIKAIPMANSEERDSERFTSMARRKKEEGWQCSSLSAEMKQFLSLEVAHIVRLTRLKEEQSYMEQMAQVVRHGLEIQRWQHRSFGWMHSEVLKKKSKANSTMGIGVDNFRDNLLNELRSHLNINLNTNDANELEEALRRYEALHSSVEQRLKWASGANNEVQDLQNAYVASFTADVETTRAVQSMKRALHAVIDAVMQHEETRGNTDEHLQPFKSALLKCRDSCQTLKTSEDQKPVGYRLFELNRPPQVLNTESCKQWLDHSEKLVALSVKETLIRAEEKKNVIKCLKHKFALDGEKLKTIVVRHQKLVADVGAILKTIAKSDEFRIPAVEEYLVDYSSFSESASKLISGMLSKEEWNEVRVRELASVAEQMKNVWVEKIYDPIIFFGEMAKDERLMDTYRVDKEEEEEKVVNNEEEKNDFALTVLKRVRKKLEGNDHLHQLTNASVQQQVEMVIDESMREESLALMYEGWTAWI